MRSGTIQDARIAITAVNPAPLLLKTAKLNLPAKVVTDELAEQVGDLAAQAAKPLTTSVLTPEYRREMVRVYAKRA